MSAFRAVVIEHFRRPRNRGALPGATVSVEGANPLCGDRIRVELLVENGAIADARFTADACAICIAAASMITEGARGMRLTETGSLALPWVYEKLEGEPPPGRKRCVTLPLDTFFRAVESAGMGA